MYKYVLHTVIVDHSIVNTARHAKKFVRFIVRQFLADTCQQVSHLGDRHVAATFLVVETEHISQVVGALDRRISHILVNQLDQCVQVHLSTFDTQTAALSLCTTNTKNDLMASLF